MDGLTLDLVLTFVTLSMLEIVLGIDNLVFISLATHKLPKEKRTKARIFGLSLALGIRILMLMALSWVMSLTTPLFSIASLDFSFKSILLLFGGLFLIGKSGHEIYHDVFDAITEDKPKSTKASTSMLFAISQIILVDFIFSFDSVITAVAITDNIPVIVGAIVISMIVMIISSESISRFLTEYPSLKIIALALIFMVGVILVFDGFGIHISKGYLYFALFFATTVEILNIVAKKR